MSPDTPASTAAQHYEQAYELHYGARLLPSAIRSYEQLITLHPSTPEADYSRAQIRNIVNLVVPVGEILAAEVELALHHLEPGGDGSSPA